MSIGRPPSSVLVLLLVWAIAAPVFAADTAQSSKSAVANASSRVTDKPPLVIHNPDGTITVQKEPTPGKSGNAKQKGLVIPPQVVVPTARLPEKDTSYPAC